MTRLTLVISSLLICLTGVGAQTGDSVSLDELLVAAKLPEGCDATTRPVKAGEQTLGRMIVVSKPGQVSKVVVRIEMRDLTGVPARRAATKGYVNGLAAGLSKEGYKIVEKTIPDIAKATFQEPVAVDLTFANGEGKKLWTHEEIFFTDKGFLVQVVGDDPATLETLTKWAKTIRPKSNP